MALSMKWIAATSLLLVLCASLLYQFVVGGSFRLDKLSIQEASYYAAIIPPSPSPEETAPEKLTNETKPLNNESSKTARPLSSSSAKKPLQTAVAASRKPQLPLTPRMSGSEQKLFTKFLNQCNSKKGVYWEFGSGGSTPLACRKAKLKKIYSVESDINWISKLKKEPDIKKAENNGRVQFFHVDINANPANWGYPTNRSHIHNWPKYSGAMNLVTPPPKPCIVLVDGRFRVACALEAWDKLANNGVVMIHDFSFRQHYHVVKKFYDVVESANSMVALRKKKKIDREAFKKVLRDHKLDYR